MSPTAFWHLGHLFVVAYWNEKTIGYRMFDCNATAREEKVEASGRDLGTLGQMEEWGPSPVARDARYVIRALTTSIGQF